MGADLSICQKAHIAAGLFFNHPDIFFDCPMARIDLEGFFKNRKKDRFFFVFSCGMVALTAMTALTALATTFELFVLPRNWQIWQLIFCKICISVRKKPRWKSCCP